VVEKGVSEVCFSDIIGWQKRKSEKSLKCYVEDYILEKVTLNVFE
jgi:hypothetical protein